VHAIGEQYHLSICGFSCSDKQSIAFDGMCLLLRMFGLVWDQQGSMVQLVQSYIDSASYHRKNTLNKFLQTARPRHALTPGHQFLRVHATDSALFYPAFFSYEPWFTTLHEALNEYSHLDADGATTDGVRARVSYKNWLCALCKANHSVAWKEVLTCHLPDTNQAPSNLFPQVA
jgi:hypothetical protein